MENNPLLQVAKELERQALEDPYFAEKKLFPNVDFYSGIILEAMGFPHVHVHADFRYVADGGVDLPSGRNNSRIRHSRSAGRVSSTRARPSAITSTSKAGDRFQLNDRRRPVGRRFCVGGAGRRPVIGASHRKWAQRRCKAIRRTILPERAAQPEPLLRGLQAFKETADPQHHVGQSRSKRAQRLAHPFAGRRPARRRG